MNRLQIAMKMLDKTINLAMTDNEMVDLKEILNKKDYTEHFYYQFIASTLITLLITLFLFF